MSNNKPVPLNRQSSEKFMWEAVLNSGKMSPDQQQTIKDAWDNSKTDINDVKKIARQEIEKQKKPSAEMMKEFNAFLKNTSAKPGNTNPFKNDELKKKSLDNTEKTKRYKESKHISRRLGKKGGRRRRTRRKRKRRMKKRRGGMRESIQPGLMQDWAGILLHDDEFGAKKGLIKEEELPNEMIRMGNSRNADKFNEQLIENSNNLQFFQNRINELDVSRRRLKESGSNEKYIDEIKRETDRFNHIMDGIKQDNYMINKNLEKITKPSTKKVVNPGKPYRRFEGGKKRKTRKKRRKRRKRRKSRR